MQIIHYKSRVLQTHQFNPVQANRARGTAGICPAAISITNIISNRSERPHSRKSRPKQTKPPRSGENRQPPPRDPKSATNAKAAPENNRRSLAPSAKSWMAGSDPRLSGSLTWEYLE